MSERDKGNLFAILDSSRKIQQFTEHITGPEEFFQDERTFDAVLMNFVIIGEAISRISDTLKNSHSHIQWQSIKGFRNIIAHDYVGVDAEEVWQIIEGHIPRLQVDIKEILDQE